MRNATYDLAARVLQQCGNNLTMLVQFNPESKSAYCFHILTIIVLLLFFCFCDHQDLCHILSVSFLNHLVTPVMIFFRIFVIF